MKSMASSIQPILAAASARHCSRVIVRYQGSGAAVVVRDMSTLLEVGCVQILTEAGLRRVRGEIADGAHQQERVDRLGDVGIESGGQRPSLIFGACIGAQGNRARRVAAERAA